MDLAGFAALLSPAGQELLAEAAEADLSEGGLLATAARLRARHPAGLVAAALTQVRLRERAREKFGPDAARMYFTPDGLEQATRSTVAAHRARRFARLTGPDGRRPVLDLCCGIGGDLVALARAGCTVTGVDGDPLTVAVARANVAALGLAGRAGAGEGDATRADPGPYAAAFADPGRRTARGRVFDPRAYRPPLDVLLEIMHRAPGGCVKVAPGIPYEAVPAGAEVEWISAGGEVKEAAIWLGGLAGSVERRATLLPAAPPGASGGPAAAPATLVPVPGLGDPPVGPWRRYLYEPDGAVIRAHLVAEVAAALDGSLVDARIAYITSDTLRPTPFATAYEIHDVLPFSVKRLRQALRARRAGIITIKKRGSAVDIERLRRDLRPAGPEHATVVLTRVGAAPVALLCEPVTDLITRAVDDDRQHRQ
ncbi:MAG TPA: class I SAM-dependent methyltransferase [Streptosporangiaceae bacterium]|nr:class I SAM-dependent methyltransferase [Streptosporangiaceae bacterium]